MSEQSTNVTEFTVTEISQAVKRTVEEAFGRVRIRGEVSGYRGPHSSGHAYFSLKDDKARIEAVIWRGVFGSLRHKPEEGMEVVATGKLTTYPGSSKYQIVIEQLEPAGAGALMALLEERRKKLLAEGLFDEDRKRPVPYLPSVIGVVTSPTGSVIRDILHRLADRFPSHVVVWPVRVQGETCGPEVAAAIAGFNALDPGGAIARPDLIIVARGGGSIEDLWGFNEEAVVRAVAASAIPVISAVGHETDTTLIDFVADKRAPTPTGAAEMAVPVRSELIGYVDTLGQRARTGQRRLVSGLADRLRAGAAGLPRPAELLATARQRHDVASMRLATGLSALLGNKSARYGALAPRVSGAALSRRAAELAQRLEQSAHRMPGAWSRRLERAQSRLANVGKLMSSLDYRNVLARGYAIARDAANEIIRSSEVLTPGTPFSLQFADGDVAARAEKNRSSPNGSDPEKPEKTVTSARSGGGQKSLF